MSFSAWIEKGFEFPAIIYRNNHRLELSRLNQEQFMFCFGHDPHLPESCEVILAIIAQQPMDTYFAAQV